jgi:hypothetical protein
MTSKFERLVLPLFLSVLFLTLPLHAQYAATPEQAKIIDGWIQRSKDRLPKWLQDVPKYRLVDKNPSFIKPWGAPLPTEAASREGIPTASGKGKLTCLQRASLKGQTLLYAQYGSSAQEASQELFLKPPKGKAKRLFHLGLCSDFNVIQLGPKAPLWVLAHDSDCGRGSTDYLHELTKDGKLRLLLKLEGRGMAWKAVDLDRDGFKEIIHSEGIQRFPTDLRSKLEKASLYKEPKGAVLQRVEILRWKGGKFSKVGEYHEHGEAW